ncbi:SDR family NAD(P)-dependent oxidoreductase [Glaciimonas sp. PAMC28666]|uniref:SDR family NAD(P)-dependent oxidoreductase n=1 Tax=Glaciimonas sp. PAMC28666 TaxID=2807626 RepID=UPI001962CF6C|nr:SDR family NAD(P)-dependent oxidoreductase [Glaciimonas sp. PAMC28666]QRX81686.1 SDR family NAD(P)-dependent oxidoreductase [Glaciimonas sp. PAMC28666]
MISFNNRIAIVTGAANGLGRSHALALAARGARVVINDLGANGEPSDAAMAVVEEIRHSGQLAMASGADVSDVDQVRAMVAEVMAAWGRIDILINNAGILRDKSFAKMTMDDFDLVVKVHLGGAANCTKAVWQTMRDQNYGRILLTSSGSGLFGNFGQANYGAAKAAMVGLMNVLHIEGAKNNIRINVLVPTAATAMTEGLLSPDISLLATPESVSPAVLFLTSESAPSKVMLSAGAGAYAVVHLLESDGIYLPPEERTPEQLSARFEQMASLVDMQTFPSAFAQTKKYTDLAKAASQERHFQSPRQDIL